MAGISSKKSNNLFPELKQASDKEDEETGRIRSEGDVLLNGADSVLTTDPRGVFRADEYYSSWTMAPAGQQLKQTIRAIAGWQNVALPPDIPL